MVWQTTYGWSLVFLRDAGLVTLSWDFYTSTLEGRPLELPLLENRPTSLPETGMSWLSVGRTGY